MVWLFDFTAPTFIVLIFFLVFYFLRPVLIAQSNRIYLTLVIAELLGFIATYTSSFVCNNYTEYNNGFIAFMNNAYYIMYVIRYFLFSLYFYSLTKTEKSNKMVLYISYVAVGFSVLLILSNPFTHAIYKLSANGMFSTGKYISLIYVVNIITILVDLYYVIRSIKKKELKERITLIGTIIILFSCCVIDLAYMDYLISDMFFLLVLHLLFLTFENPDLYLDKKVSLFNLPAFRYAMQDNISCHKDYSVFGFVILNYNEVRSIYGIKQMDHLLKEIADYLYINFSNINFYYLQNGRFTALYHGEANRKKLMDEISQKFAKPWKLNNVNNIQLKVTVVDVVEDLKYISFDYLKSSFDLAFKSNSNTKGNKIAINQDIFGKVMRNINVSRALNTALVNESLLVYAQPIVNAKTKEIVAAEALVRINDSKIGLIPPGEFISIAEQNGCIEQLCEQVLHQVCAFLSTKNLREYGIQWINVNLSPLQCLDPYLLETINDIVDSYGIDHSIIHLEITEDSMINKDILLNQMKRFRESGYNISLDDFGSGFSNLSLIKEFPFTDIKLDMSIVRQHFTSPDSMLPGIINIFHDKGLSVTAEGVETKEVAEGLEKLGCNYLQGYYFSKPLPIDEFTILLKVK